MLLLKHYRRGGQSKLSKEKCGLPHSSNSPSTGTFSSPTAPRLAGRRVHLYTRDPVSAGTCQSQAGPASSLNLDQEKILREGEEGEQIPCGRKDDAWEELLTGAGKAA